MTDKLTARIHDEITEDGLVGTYDIISSPNDFNVVTLFSLINSGKLSIPSFQRNYVWDIGKASKLIESLVIGLPVPQIFLYDDSGKYSVIDGQQRMLTIYYFMAGRFPKKDKRGVLRQLFERKGRIPEEDLASDEYFTKFTLKLPAEDDTVNVINTLHKKNYATLGSYRDDFDFRTIRCVIIKQVSPSEDKSSVFEIFNRLNSGGVNLTSQEIRLSLYHSQFMIMLTALNANKKWRALLDLIDVDVHMRDVEILLRGIAALEFGKEYSSPMKRFLNIACYKAAKYDADQIDRITKTFDRFLECVDGEGGKLFEIAEGRFSVPLFEVCFKSICEQIEKGGAIASEAARQAVCDLKNSREFLELVKGKTTNKTNYDRRLVLAEEAIGQRMAVGT